jgi:replication-associated recombination protein RarA
MVLYEKWRPKSLDEIVGQDEVVKRLKLLRDTSGYVGQVLWFHGPSGGGKSSAARVIANEVNAPYRPVSINAQRVTLEMVRDWQLCCRMRPLGAKGHAFVVDESHLLRGPIISEFQTVLEEPEVQRTATFIFTTTPNGQQKLFDSKSDFEPFLSRAKVYEFSTHGHELDFAQRVMEIARAENLDGRPLDEYVELIRRCKGNLRSALNAVESGEMLK